MFRAPDGKALFVRRSAHGDHAGEWAFPGGGLELDETPKEGARREVYEELGVDLGVEYKPFGHATEPVDYTTFEARVPEPFLPRLNGEHTEFVWADPAEPPQPLHPGVAFLLSGVPTEDMPAMDAARLIAMDKDTVRRIDGDGHMFVEATPISKANVCPYNGNEIPSYQSLGLDPYKVYYLYRDPTELEKAAKSFAGKPLLLNHKALTAEQHPESMVVGAVGDAVAFAHPYLTAPLVVWRGDAIELVDSGEQKELSSAYRYDADMTAGISPEGERYDGIMRNISGNHVALVREGRAGPDVVVADAVRANVWELEDKMAAPRIDVLGHYDPDNSGRTAYFLDGWRRSAALDKRAAAQDSKETTMAKSVMTRMASVAHGAIVAYMLPRLAQDAAIDFGPVMAKVGKTFDAKKLTASVGKLVTGKLAEDANIDDLGDLLNSIAKLPVAEDATPTAGKPALDEDDKGGKLREFLKDKISEDDMRACDAIMGKDSDEEDDDQEAMDSDEPDEDDNEGKKDAETTTGKDRRRGAKDAEKDDNMVTKDAMRTEIKVAVAAAKQAERDVRQAEQDVLPYIGRVAVTCDAAHEVYKLALDSLGVELEGVPPSAYRAVLKTQLLPGTQRQQEATPRIATDAKGVQSFNDMFPEAKNHPVHMA